MSGSTWFQEIEGEPKEDRRIRYRRENAKRYKTDPAKAEKRRQAKRDFHAKRKTDDVRWRAELDRSKKKREEMSPEKRAEEMGKARVRASKWHEENRDYVLAKNAANVGYFRAYVANNRERYRAHDAKRRAAKINGTPAWADLEKINEVYANAMRLQSETGILHEVDHIVPLRGRLVCGLHVHWNLRAIPRAENRRKSNRLIDALGIHPTNP